MSDALGRLAIHVLGGGIGESVVIESPTGGWGVVDCYAGPLDRPEENPTLRFLRKRGVKKLDFLCLTHPHDDHFRGICHLLEETELEIEQFWRFASLTKADLKHLVEVRAADAVRRGDFDSREIHTKDPMVQILRLVSCRKKCGRTKVRPLQGQAPIYPYPVSVGGGPPRDEFEIWVFGPSPDRAEYYKSLLRRCFTPGGQLDQNAAPSLPHNEISVAIMIRYGVTRVILGGDMEAANWRCVLNECQRGDLAVQAVKVSHHGSPSGYTADLWETLSAGGDPVALITPSIRHGLPTREAVQHIRNHTPHVYATCLPAVKYLESPGIRFHGGYQPDDEEGSPASKNQASGA